MQEQPQKLSMPDALMRIVKGRPDDKGYIDFDRCVAIMSFIIEEGQPVIFAAVDIDNKYGRPMRFIVKSEGDVVNTFHMERYAITLTSSYGTWLIFESKPESRSVNKPVLVGVS